MKIPGCSFAVILLSLGAYTAQATLPNLPEATLTAQVVDEKGFPVEGAATRVFFESTDDVTKEGVSNKDGVFIASARTSGVAFFLSAQIRFLRYPFGAL